MPIGASLIDPNTPGIFGNNANPGGSNQAVPTAASNNTPAIGGGTNPLVPQFPGGTSTPNISSSINLANVPAFPANGTGTAAPGSTDASGAAGLDIFNLSGGRPQPPGGQSMQTFMSNLITGFKNAGIGSAQGALLANFLLNGAGFNPQVAQAMIAAMQPQVNRGEADIMEWLGSNGLSSSSSSAGIGLGDYLSQVQLNEGAIMSNLYEQSVQNYLSVLMGAKQTSHGPDLLSQVMGTMSTLAGIAGTSTGGGGTLGGDAGL
jgi:hypothetical protein